MRLQVRAYASVREGLSDRLVVANTGTPCSLRAARKNVGAKWDHVYPERRDPPMTDYSFAWSRLRRRSHDIFTGKQGSVSRSLCRLPACRRAHEFSLEARAFSSGSSVRDKGAVHSTRASRGRNLYSRIRSYVAIGLFMRRRNRA